MLALDDVVDGSGDGFMVAVEIQHQQHLTLFSQIPTLTGKSKTYTEVCVQWFYITGLQIQQY